jgi:glucose-1-phosphate thymidylyltransferase
LIAVLPAAGHAHRLEPLRRDGTLSGSKEIHPVPGLDDSRRRPVCLHLLESLALAGVDRTFVVVRRGKEDIPHTLGSGASLDSDWQLDLAYLWVEDSQSVPETLDRAWNHIRGHRVLLGFPDTLFEPQDAFVHLLREQEMSGADLVLGLFPADRPETTDMVEVDAVGNITAIEVRPQETDLTHNWLLALWTPRFSAFLHNQVTQHRAERLKDPDQDLPELQLGKIFQVALAAGFALQGVTFSEGRYVDVGQP